MSKTEHLLWQ